MNLTKKIVTLTLSGTAACLIACGEDSSTEVVNHSANGSMDVLARNENLSEQICDDENIGQKLFVLDSNAAFVCDGESWGIYDASEGFSGKCSTKSVKNASKTETGVQITCDGAVVDTLWNGERGKDGADGDDCSARPVKDEDETMIGTELMCGGVVVDTIWNGVNGKDGVDGKDGADGKDGIDGTDGLNGKDGVDGKDGRDGVDGKDGADGKNGVDGKDGKDGVDGKDGANGKDGKDGANGKDGEDGENCTIISDINGVVKLGCANGVTTIYKAMCGMIPYDPAVSYCKNGFVLAKEGKFPSGFMQDERDDQIYDIVQIGNKVWMGGNLNVETEGSMCAGGSPTNPKGDCDTYGRLYTYAAASKACPTGWRLPTSNEVYAVYSTVENAISGSVSSALRSSGSWSAGAGDDAIGFSAEPSGYYRDGSYYGAESIFQAWTSTAASGKHYVIQLSPHMSAGLHLGDEDDTYQAVRCVKE